MSKVTAGAKAKLNLEYCDEDVNLEDYNIPSDFNLEEVKSINFSFIRNCFVKLELCCLFESKISHLIPVFDYTITIGVSLPVYTNLYGY